MLLIPTWKQNNPFTVVFNATKHLSTFCPVKYDLSFAVVWQKLYIEISAEMIQLWVPVLVSDKGAFNESGCVFDLIIALVVLMADPPFALLWRTVEPQHQHHQSQQEQGHRETQHHPLQDAWGIIWSCRVTKKRKSVINSPSCHSKPVFFHRTQSTFWRLFWSLLYVQSQS